MSANRASASSAASSWAAASSVWKSSTRLLQGGNGRGLSDARYPREPLKGCGGNASWWHRPQIERPDCVEPIEVAVEFGRHPLRRNGPQSIQGGERGGIARVEQPSDARALIITQAGDQMAPEPRSRPVADSPDQSFDNRDAWQKHLVGNEPCRGSLDQGAGPIISAPAQSVEPSGQPEAGRGVVAEVGEATMRPDQRQVPDASTSLEIGINPCRGFKAKLLDHCRQNRRRDIGRRDRKRPQKSNTRQHHGKAEPIMIASQRPDEVVVGSVQMEVPGELIGRRFAVEAGKTLALNVREVAGRHIVRRGWATPESKANYFANHMREIGSFCSRFRTDAEVAA
ncbi:hypothetical protein OVA00_08920 [Ensifer sp. SL37]|nr:hypothetical protein [Ensifer sp. SL37]MCY1740642.1 hypothetical protein [Ensifer sp. SL37]